MPEVVGLQSKSRLMLMIATEILTLSCKRNEPFRYKQSFQSRFALYAGLDTPATTSGEMEADCAYCLALDSRASPYCKLQTPRRRQIQAYIAVRAPPTYLAASCWKALAFDWLSLAKALRTSLPSSSRMFDVLNAPCGEPHQACFSSSPGPLPVLAPAVLGREVSSATVCAAETCDKAHGICPLASCSRSCEGCKLQLDSLLEAATTTK